MCTLIKLITRGLGNDLMSATWLYQTHRWPRHDPQSFKDFIATNNPFLLQMCTKSNEMTDGDEDKVEMGRCLRLNRSNWIRTEQPSVDPEQLTYNLLGGKGVNITVSTDYIVYRCKKQGRRSYCTPCELLFHSNTFSCDRVVEIHKRPAVNHPSSHKLLHYESAACPWLKSRHIRKDKTPSDCLITAAKTQLSAPTHTDLMKGQLYPLSVWPPSSFWTFQTFFKTECRLGAVQSARWKVYVFIHKRFQQRTLWKSCVWRGWFIFSWLLCLWRTYSLSEHKYICVFCCPPSDRRPHKHEGMSVCSATEIFS